MGMWEYLLESGMAMKIYITALIVAGFFVASAVGWPW